MPNIVDLCNPSVRNPVFICDFSPPRSGDISKFEPSKYLNADVISVAYSPGKFPAADTLASSLWIEQNTTSQSLLNLATRDMNKLAVQNKLLGAELLGLKNILAIQGDKFTNEEAQKVKPVDDYTTTSLLEDIENMNHGFDFRGRELKMKTNLCAGSSLDISRDSKSEISLTYKKFKAGSKFFVTQPIFNLKKAQTFKNSYCEKYNSLEIPNVFWGIQILARENITFSKIPEQITNDLNKGRTGFEIASEQIHEMLIRKMQYIYLIPTIFPNGTRDYESAQHIIESFK